MLKKHMDNTTFITILLYVFISVRLIFAKVKLAENESFSDFEVQPELRQKGVGEKLLRAIVDELKVRGVKTVTGFLDHIGSLKNRMKVFGVANIRLRANVGNNWEVGDKLLTFEEAQKELENRRYVFCESDLSEPTESNEA